MTDPHASPQDHGSIRDSVRAHYAAVVDQPAGAGCCSSSAAVSEPDPTSEAACCGSGPQQISLALGYSSEDLDSVPAGADLGLGCGNPHALALLEPGMTVLDLGCGAGFDVFLAARAVGPQGHVIGVDMTPEMLARARGNAVAAGYANVDFRLGEIEHLPVRDTSVDVIISNCVINLSPDKQAVFDESFRVLRPGGRLAVSDVVASAELPAEVLEDAALYAGCIAGAATVEQTRGLLERAGFVDVRVTPVDESREFIATWTPGGNAADFIVSASIEGTRPVSGPGRTVDSDKRSAH